ncbi:hypothetical protein D3C76_956070 [compost metagenome]
MHHHEHAGDVGDDDHGTVDLLQLVLDGVDPGGKVQLVVLQRRHGAHLGQLFGQQRLPVLGHVVAQAGNNEDGCAVVVGHVITLLRRWVGHRGEWNLVIQTVDVQGHVRFS